MSILIKGMEMPKQGRVTLQIGTDGAVYVVDKCEITAEKYEKNLEAVEVPPHGRLIDADELIAKQEEDAEIFMGSTNYGDKVRYDEAMNAVANIVNAPTVIEASEVE